MIEKQINWIMIMYTFMKREKFILVLNWHYENLRYKVLTITLIKKFILILFLVLLSGVEFKSINKSKIVSHQIVFILWAPSFSGARFNIVSTGILNILLISTV